MAFLYRVILNKDPKKQMLYSDIRCHKITQRTRIDKKDKSYFACTYYSEGRQYKKCTEIEEGIPNGKSLAFWLNERDDERAINIFKTIFTNRYNLRRKKVKNEAEKLIWEKGYINDLNADSITYQSW